MRNKRKLVCGVGVNDATYPVSVYEGGKKVWRCPFYSRWCHMLHRVYSESYLRKKPSYIGCSVCDEWLTFSNFKAWMEAQDWEGKHLDKDILHPGNKIYSPNTCCFVDSILNTFITESDKMRGELPIGVSKCGGRRGFMACCSNPDTGKNKTLGRFETPEEAHEEWRKEKLRIARILASRQTDPRVAKAIVARYENYERNYGD